jgi:isocitrate dehydrogenase (NAD+)
VRRVTLIKGDGIANVRPSKTLIRGGCYEDVDLVVVRENTEGPYTGIEHYAFELARRRPPRQLTLVHKANILKYTSGCSWRQWSA